ncbi:MAG: GDP-mannose 4,6-dehydratase [Actinomycetota bacterium]|nr:GDP-mannose 4,6-dehydratase [Actinomycetota bacterium]
MRALITGVTGQDGSYLAEQLTAEGWEVAGLIRGQANPKREWLERLIPSLTLVEGDLLDATSLHRAVAGVQPDVVFNLAAITYAGISWPQPGIMAEVTGLGVLRVLDAIRQACPDARLVQASTAAMFRGSPGKSQDEGTPLAPGNPYSSAKAYAHFITVNYRESYGMHASTVIMFNHESPRRGTEFVTRKITRAVAAIARGEQDKLMLGRLDPLRDWGWAPDFMRALPLAAAQDEPGDYVLATGEAHSVAEFCAAAFAAAGLDWKDHVVTSEGLHRPAEIDILRGNPARAREVLGWESRVRFAEIAQRMTAHDMAGTLD